MKIKNGGVQVKIKVVIQKEKAYRREASGEDGGDCWSGSPWPIGKIGRAGWNKKGGRVGKRWGGG